MKILALIPARYASSRFPGKPLALIGGVPMIEHVYKRASEIFENVYVVTDDERIVAAVRNFNGNFFVSQLQHETGTSRCFEAWGALSEKTGELFDVVVNIQGDEPFVDTQQLKTVVECFDNEETDIATLVKKFDSTEDIFNANKVKVVFNKKGKALYFSRSPIPYIRNSEREKWQEKHNYFQHIGIYAFRSSVLKNIFSCGESNLEIAESLEQLKWLEYGFNITVAETTHQSLAVDTPEDLVAANNFFQKKT